jgi:NAD(P)-dependent dehydrogenase (short-subunit alcohol dehydrogenase family)
MKSKEHLVIITGHSSGLGRALLDICLQDGVHVLGIARRRLDLQHPHLRQIQADFSALDHRIEKVLQPLSMLDPDNNIWQSITLVNNAGTVLPVGMLGELDAQAIAASLHTNLTIPLQLSNWLLHHYPQQNLRIAHISSGAAHKPYAGWGVYCSSKAGLRMGAQVMATEAEAMGRNLRVLVYEPGVLDTPMQAELRQTTAQSFPQVERFRQLQINGQLVAPHESAFELWQHLTRPDLPAYLETRYGAAR